MIIVNDFFKRKIEAVSNQMEACLDELGGKIISASRFLGQEVLKEEDIRDNIFIYTPFKYKIALIKEMLNKSKESILVFEEEPSIFKRILFNLSRRDVYISMYRKPYKKYINHIKKYKYLKKIFVELESHKKILIENGIDKNKILVVPTPAKVRFCQNKKEFNPEKIKLVFASWNNTDKIDTTKIRGLFYLVDCLKKHKNLSLNIVLRDNRTKILDNYIKQNEVDKQVEYIEIKNDEELEKVFDESDFAVYLLQKQIVKDVPNSLIDGLSRGKPIFMTDVLSFHEVVSAEQIGFVVKPNCPVIDFKITKAEYDILSKNAYNFAKKHSISHYTRVIKGAID